MLFEPYVRFHIFSSWYKYIICHLSFFPIPRLMEWEILYAYDCPISWSLPICTFF